MQVIILAAGESSRFYPFNGLHKSLIRILGKSIIEHTLLSVKKSGIKDVIIVVGKDGKVENLVGSLGDLELNIRYVFQKNAAGMGDALLSAEKYIKSDFFFLHAHHVDFFKFKQILEKKKEDNGIVLLTKNISDSLSLRKSGVLKTKGDRVLEVMEKPLPGKEPSNLGIIGIYLLNKRFVETLKEAPKEHYNFEKSISLFAKKENVRFAVTNIENVSLKYPWDILHFKDYMLKDIKNYIADTAIAASSAQISGKVYIDEFAKIMENAIIKGPCYIGRNVFIGNNAVLRSGTDIEENSVTGANMEVKNTLMMENSKVHSGFIGDSVIGENCRIGAGFNTANVRLDRATVKSIVKNEKIDTGLKSLGVMIGNDTHIGIKSSTMPGIIIGKRVIIGANTSVVKNVFDDTRYYTKFQEVVSKKNE